MPQILPISDAEWNFLGLSDEQLLEALVWEYARSQAWLRKAIKQSSSRKRRKDKSEDQEYPALADLEVTRRRITPKEIGLRWAGSPRAHSSNKNQGAFDVIEIWERRSPQGAINPFIHHDCHFILGAEFPGIPYGEATLPIALIEHLEAIRLPVVYDLKFNSITETGTSRLRRLEAKSKNAKRSRRVVSELNGLPINLEPNVFSWRKFALALDFARTDEELVLAFRDFLKAARQTYGLPVTKKTQRSERGGAPSWLTVKFALASLSALGAHRLIEHFKGDAAAAFNHWSLRFKALGRSKVFISAKEMRRAAARFPVVARKLFGDGPTAARK
jgi:hypothetical protein